MDATLHADLVHTFATNESKRYDEHLKIEATLFPNRISADPVWTWNQNICTDNGI